MTSLFRCVLLFLCLTAANPAAGEAARFAVGFAQDTLANDWRQAQAHTLASEFARHPQVQFRVTDAHGKTARQIMDVEDLVAAGVDLLISSPKDELAMTPVISAAHRAGTPVILLTRRVASDRYTTYIAPDDGDIARRAARFIAKRLHGKGRVLILQGVPTATTAKIRTRAFLEEIQRFPQIEIAGIEPANYLRSDAIRAMERVLAEGIAFDAIYAQSDSMAAGARMALTYAGIEPSSLITVGIDYIGEAREAIRRGDQTASFTYPLCAVEAVTTAMRILHGEPVPKSIVIPSTMVTAENVERVEPVF